MERKFEVGDRVRLNSPGDERHGMVCTVISPLRQAGRTRKGVIKEGEWVHEIDLPTPDQWCTAIAKPSELVPVYDGDEKVAWSDCVWQPNQLVRI